MAESEQKRDFFISRNKADRDWAQWIAWQLEEAGYTTVLQDWDFRPGQNFVLKMHEAAANCERTIAVLSADYLAAEFSAAEWAARFVEDPTGEDGKLITVRVGECDPPGLLKSVIYIDLVDLTEKRAKETLLAGMKRGRAKPKSPPRFPKPATEAAEQPPRFPAALPPIWNVPHLRNPNFTGREDLLTQLRDKLTSGEHAAVTQAVSGLGGVGKTQLATEYAYRHASDYELVWWVRSEEPARLASDYAGLAGALGLPEKDATEQSAAIEAVRRWLEQNGGWLLVFDNVPGRQDVRDYLPQGGTGHVIITSRDPIWSGVASPLAVQVWPRGESIKFLVNRTDESDEAAANELAEAVGDLPLALERAAAYMDETRRSIASYLDLFRGQQRDLLNRRDEAADYPLSVAAALELSIERVEEDTRAAADLLNLCAFLAPDDIPLDIIRAGTEHLPERLAAAARDDLAWDKAIGALLRYSLVERSGDALSVHRLVQAVTRDRLAEDETGTWAGAAVSVLDGAFPSDVQNDLAAWPVCSLLLPHALVATAHAEGLNVALESVSGLLNPLGMYLRVRARFSEARAVFERAVAIGEAAFGPDHPAVGYFVSNLGGALQDLGDLAGAQAQRERALQMAESAYGPDHEPVGLRANNLGDVLRQRGDLVGAHKQFKRAHRIQEATYGPDDPRTAMALGNLGGILGAMGQFQIAKNHLERALAIHETAFGPNHLHTGTSHGMLARVLEGLGDIAGARAHIERAVIIYQDCLVRDHPQTQVAREYLESLGK